MNTEFVNSYVNIMKFYNHTLFTGSESPWR